MEIICFSIYSMFGQSFTEKKNHSFLWDERTVIHTVRAPHTKLEVLSYSSWVRWVDHCTNTTTQNEFHGNFDFRSEISLSLTVIFRSLLSRISPLLLFKYWFFCDSEENTRFAILLDSTAAISFLQSFVKKPSFFCIDIKVRFILPLDSCWETVVEWTKKRKSRKPPNKTRKSIVWMPCSLQRRRRKRRRVFDWCAMRFCVLEDKSSASNKTAALTPKSEETQVKEKEVTASEVDQSDVNIERMKTNAVQEKQKQIENSVLPEKVTNEDAGKRTNKLLEQKNSEKNQSKSHVELDRSSLSISPLSFSADLSLSPDFSSLSPLSPLPPSNKSKKVTRNINTIFPILTNEMLYRKLPDPLKLEANNVRHLFHHSSLLIAETNARQWVHCWIGDSRSSRHQWRILTSLLFYKSRWTSP